MDSVIRSVWRRVENHLAFFLTCLAVLLVFLCVLNRCSAWVQSWTSFDVCGTYALVALLAAFWVQIPRLKWQNVWYPISLGVLAFPFFCFALGSTGFLFGISITKWHGVLSLLLTLVTMAWFSETRKSFVVSCLLFSMIWGVSLFFAVIGWERREDAMIYHKPASEMLAKGWNPVWQEDLASYVTSNGGDPITFRYSHAAWFPKGLWVVNATLHRMTGTCDASTSIYPAMMPGCLILFYFMLQEWFLCWRWPALLLSAALALNPNIMLEELFTSMIDGPLGLCLLIFLFACILWLRTGRTCWLPFLIGSAVFGCSMKHNAPIFFAFMGFLYSLLYVWEFWRNRNRLRAASRGSAKAIAGAVAGSEESGQRFQLHVRFRTWLLALLAVPTLVTVFCFNPYVTNLLRHSSPFYPLHSFAPKTHPAEDILSIYYVRPDFRQADRVQRFLYTFLQNRIYFVSSLTDQSPEFTPRDVKFFQFRLNYDSIGIFPLMLIFSLPLLFFVRRWDFWMVLFVILLSTAIHPHFWWGRFVPQLWALPFLVFGFTYHEVCRPKCASAEERSLRFPVSFWERRWQWIFYVLMSWSVLIHMLIGCHMAYFQLLYAVSQDLYLEMARQNPEMVVIGGITRTVEGEKTELASHPVYFYHFNDFFKSMGYPNVHVTFLNLTVPETYDSSNFNRIIFIWPKSFYPDGKTPTKSVAEIPASVYHMLQIRWRQLACAWLQDGYPYAPPVTGPANPQAAWIQELKSKETSDIPRTFEGGPAAPSKPLRSETARTDSSQFPKETEKSVDGGEK